MILNLTAQEKDRLTMHGKIAQLSMDEMLHAALADYIEVVCLARIDYEADKTIDVIKDNFLD